mgnify:CR=1 FL=1|tara:strand:- start:614 stop:1555 length:942 start_codon:yes stop_codon:yes gene_type:complete
MATEEGKNSLKVIAEQNKSINRILVIIIIILSVVLGITLWQYFELRKTVSQKGTEIEILDDERNELQSELEDMLTEFDSLETNNDSMKVELAQRRLEVEELLDKVKDKDYAIYKLKKETKTLRTIMKGYVVTIDSLNTLNVGLRKENQAVREDLSRERTKTQSLEKTNENLSSKVALASRLDVNNVRAFGVNVKRDMTGKETDRARKSDKIRICFTIDENKVAKAEKKDIYIRIIAPDGVLLSPGFGDEYRFEFNGSKGYFTDKESIEYQNAPLEVCLDWAKPTEDYEVLQGVYNVFIYAEDYEMAKTTFELR